MPNKKAPISVPRTIDEYIRAAAPAVRPVLKRIRATIAAVAPEAEERISYRMPAFRRRGILLYFAAFQHHIGLFPPVQGDAALLRELRPFTGPKGNLKFPLDRPIPYDLIRRIARLRLEQDRAKEPARARVGAARRPAQDGLERSARGRKASARTARR